MDADISYFAETNFRNRPVPFGIRQGDRLSHMLALGRTGAGKSTLLLNLIQQDLKAGRGFALIDPHGDLADAVAKGAEGQVIYLNVPDPIQPFGYNPLRRVRDDKIPLAASGLLETFRKLWPTAWGIRMEHLLRNSLYALLERDGSTLPDILRLYSDDGFRRGVTRSIRNPVVRSFWRNEFEQYPPRLRVEACAPIQNKLSALLSDPTLYRILVNPSRDLHLRTMMDSGQALVVNLSRGQLGEDSALTLGALMLSTLGLAGFSRADVPETQRRPFFIYADEFHLFTTLSLVSMLAELRKHAVGMILATQHLAALEADIRHALLGNVGTVVSFRLGVEDASLIAREMHPVFGADDLLNLPNFHIYVKLMIDGAPGKPFSAKTIKYIY
ncbi:DUF87 domain-containing protein [Sphingobium sp. AN641]|uniref:type IV secretory system conjugative DNA transfer family protein n=1 Tax=Sphingobium sp. AN641 TaxID=3133443 RepID=UPI0030BEEAE8